MEYYVKSVTFKDSELNLICSEMTFIRSSMIDKVLECALSNNS